MATSGLADPLSRALDEAIAGRRDPLVDLLTRASHLPGPRANDALATAFAHACRAQGARADGVALALSRLTADEAPGATAREFLPVCGIAAVGARGAADASCRAALLAELHARADDLRFRVRDAVVGALGQIGGAVGDVLVADVAEWMDGYFHAAAVLRAMAAEPWQSTLRDAALAVRRLGESYDLARRAPRAAARYPGRKALVDALRHAPVAFAVRFGVPVFDALAGWARTDDPGLRSLVAAILAEKRLASRFSADVGRVQRVLDETRAPARNPDHDVGRTRDRSGGRRGRRR